MDKFFGKKTFLNLVLFAALFAPEFVLGATFHIDSDKKDFFVGDNLVFDVKIDSLDKNINAVEGSIILDYLPKQVSVSGLSTVGSSFSLWPRKPSLSADGKTISFVGGVPNGLKGKDESVFKIVLNLEKTGKLIFKSSNLAVYLNDGKGTKNLASFENLEINILPKSEDLQSRQEWAGILSSDHTPPEPFEIYVGRDKSIFDGKRFLVFNAEDKESGIEYYEVKEGNLSPVRSGNTYVLQEQDVSDEVIVTAFDLAKNARKSIYNQKTPKFYYVIMAVFLALIVVVFLTKKIRWPDF